MTPSESFQSLPAIGLVGQESNFKVIGSNVCDGMILHAPLRSVGVGLPTVSTEREQCLAARCRRIKVERLQSASQRLVETTCACPVGVAYAQAGVCLKASCISIPMSTEAVHVKRRLSILNNALGNRLWIRCFTALIVRFPHPLLAIRQHLLHDVLERCRHAWEDQ